MEKEMEIQDRRKNGFVCKESLRIKNSLTMRVVEGLKSLPRCFVFQVKEVYEYKVRFPEIVCCFYGKFIVFKIKPVNRVTDREIALLEDIEYCNGRSYILRHIDDFLEILDKMKKELSNF